MEKRTGEDALATPENVAKWMALWEDTYNLKRLLRPRSWLRRAPYSMACFDHLTLWVVRGGSSYVYLGQPYIPCVNEEALAPVRTFANANNLALIINPALSWWNPTQTTAVLLCEPYTGDRFLPEGCLASVQKH